MKGGCLQWSKIYHSSNTGDYHTDGYNRVYCTRDISFPITITDYPNAIMISNYDISTITTDSQGLGPLALTYSYVLSNSMYRLGITYADRNISINDTYNTKVICVSK